MVVPGDGASRSGLGSLWSRCGGALPPRGRHPGLRLPGCTPRPGRVRGRSDYDLHVERGLEATADADLVCLSPKHEFLRHDPAVLGRPCAWRTTGGAIIYAHARACSTSARLASSTAASAPPTGATPDLLAAAYPEAKVSPDVLHATTAPCSPGAGSAAGIDASLHLLREQHGAAVAVPRPRAGSWCRRTDATAARRSSSCGRCPTATRRPWDRCCGGSSRTSPRTSASRPWRGANHMSERTFARRFRAETGTTPHSWVTRQRVQAAEELLERTDHSVGYWVAGEVGFGNAATLRHFARVRGLGPSSTVAGSPVDVPAPKPSRRAVVVGVAVVLVLGLAASLAVVLGRMTSAPDAGPTPGAAGRRLRSPSSSGDWTWRYRLWKHFRDVGADVDLVGTDEDLAGRRPACNLDYADPDFDRTTPGCQQGVRPGLARPTGSSRPTPTSWSELPASTTPCGNGATAEQLLEDAEQFADARTADPVDIVLGAFRNAGRPPSRVRRPARRPGRALAGDRAVVGDRRPGAEVFVQEVDTHDAAHPSASRSRSLPASRDVSGWPGIGRAHQVAHRPAGPDLPGLQASAGPDLPAVLSWEPLVGGRRNVWLRVRRHAGVSSSAGCRSWWLARRGPPGLVLANTHEIRVQMVWGPAISVLPMS